jgi:hypothetical protein
VPLLRREEFGEGTVLLASLVLWFFSLSLDALELLLDLDGKFALEAFDRVAEGVLVRASLGDVMVVAGDQSSLEVDLWWCCVSVPRANPIVHLRL